VTELVKSAEGLSKSLQKKCIKNAEIAAKKLAKGGSATAPAVKTWEKKSVGGGGAADAKGPTAPPPPPAPTGAGVVGSAEREVIGDLLAAIESMGLPSEAMATLRENEAVLGQAITPQMNALRNASYASGFAHAK